MRAFNARCRLTSPSAQVSALSAVDASHSFIGTPHTTVSFHSIVVSTLPRIMLHSVCFCSVSCSTMGLCEALMLTADPLSLSNALLCHGVGDPVETIGKQMSWTRTKAWEKSNIYKPSHTSPVLVHTTTSPRED